MKNYKRIAGSNLAPKLSNILNTHEKFRSSYFWSAPTTASARRAMERRYSTDLKFNFQDDLYEVKQTVTASARHVRYSMNVLVNGKKKDVRAIKRLIS